MHYIIATHHNMASGTADAIKILKGNYDNISVLNAYVESDDFGSEYSNCLEKLGENEKIIVLTDLAGGSVNQLVMKTKTDRQIEIVSGINLDVVLALLSLKEDEDIPQQIREIVNRSKEQMIYINQFIGKLIERDKR